MRLADPAPPSAGPFPTPKPTAPISQARPPTFTPSPAHTPSRPSRVVPPLRRLGPYTTHTVAPPLLRRRSPPAPCAASRQDNTAPRRTNNAYRPQRRRRLHHQQHKSPPPAVYRLSNAWPGHGSRAHLTTPTLAHPQPTNLLTCTGALAAKPRARSRRPSISPLQPCMTDLILTLRPSRRTPHGLRLSTGFASRRHNADAAPRTPSTCTSMTRRPLEQVATKTDAAWRPAAYLAWRPCTRCHQRGGGSYTARRSRITSRCACLIIPGGRTLPPPALTALTASARG